jgi:LysR family transcriptional regulator, hca operon transcriptional activator
MLIIGCDFHSRFQQIAMLDEKTGEMIERRLEHETGEARAFYGALPTPALVGMEATGYAHWFQRMLAEQGHELWVGDAAEIRARMVRKQKTDKRDAAHLLSLLLENRFPRIWIPSAGERDLRQLLRHRFKLICMRSSVKNQLHALAMGQGVCRMKKLWAPAGRKELEALALDPWAKRRRQEFLTGHELTWMPEALRILRDELPNIDVMISSQYSPQLADAIVKGNVDAAFLRREQGVPELAFRPLVKEPLVVVLPSDHRLAKRKAISPGELVGETFVGVSYTAPVLRAVIDDYLKRSGINITPDHETEHVVMGVSLIASMGGVGLLPAYAKNFLTRSVTSRPLKGDTPTVELVLGYKKSNESPILKLLLSRLDELVARVSKKAH